MIPLPSGCSARSVDAEFRDDQIHSGHHAQGRRRRRRCATYRAVDLAAVPKNFDDREQEWELAEDRYRSPIPEKLRWRNWATDAEGLTGDDLLDFANNTLFRELKAINPDRSPRHRVIHDVFEDAYQYMKSGTLLRQVINKLNESLDFNRSEDRHVFGDLYEQILKDLQSAGNAGEYYTPRAVTQFMVDMVNPRLGEASRDAIRGRTTHRR